MTVDTRDRFIAKSLFCRGEYELDLMLATTAHLRAIGLLGPRGTGTMLDIGANMGVTSVGMLHNQEFARAVAIEPDPHNFALLQKNAGQNGLHDRIICIQCAASDRPGQLQFELSNTNFGDHRVRGTGPAGSNEIYQESGRRVIHVEARPLDDMIAALPPEFRDSLALLWMDVQGFEGSVFRGASQLLKSPIPIATEVWPYGIARAGMSKADFCELIQASRPYYWMLRGPRGRQHFVKYPTSIFETVFDEVGDSGGYDNVLLTM